MNAKDYEELSKKISEIIHSPISKDELFMREVYLVASRSRDPRTKIGAILVKDDDVISSGFNDFPRKVDNLKYRYEDRETKYSFIVHAEHNAILNAARKGQSTLDSTLYTNGIPCCECAKACIQAGITKIICHSQWPNLTHSDKWIKSVALTDVMFKESQIKVEWFDKKLNVIGFLDGKEINV